MKEGDKIPAEFLKIYSSSASLAVDKEDEDAFERFCDLRISEKTIAVIGAIWLLMSAYMFAMSMINPKSRYVFGTIFGLTYLVRNPLTACLVYFRKRIHSGLPTHPYIVSISPHFPLVLNLFAVFSAFAFSLFLILRVLYGRCESLDQFHMWSCNSEYDSHALPQEIVLCMMFIPFVYSIAFKTIRAPFVLASWVIVVASLIIAILIGEAYQSISCLVFYVPLSLLTLYEIHRQKVMLFLLVKRQQELSEDIKRMSEESQTELRFMIANMAHDLKTPLSAFMNGVETLNSLIREVAKLGPVNAPLFAQVTDSLKNLTTVNSFMTMTVNRCIDYMKASKGIKLEPRLETINLQEVLSMPLNCMRDLQSRITIRQNPIPVNVCSHIITDLQWFQENLFCLISNAVKYSSHGHISVSVALANASHPRISSFKRRKASAVSPTSSSAECEGQTHEKYSFLDRLTRPNVSASTFASSDMSIGSESNPEAGDLESGNPSKSPNNSIHKRAADTWSRSKNPSKVYCADPTSTSRLTLTIDTNREAMLLIEVEDTGIGLSDEVKEALFTPFKQAQRRAGGTGLGLYSLAKRVDALGGYYGVSNRRDGEQGSIFWFAIPYRPDTSPLTNKTPMARKYSASHDMVVQDLTDPPPPAACAEDEVEITPVSSEKKAASVVSVPAVPAGKLRVLLVDDNLTILKMTSNLLKRHGHVVDQEENGADALKALERSRTGGFHYDVMLIDLNMPVMDGLEATKRLRELERQSSARSNITKQHQMVFAFSANSDNDALTEAMEAGADDFICKPFSIQTFDEKIKKWELV